MQYLCSLTIQWRWANTCDFSVGGMTIHRSSLFWCSRGVHQNTRVLTKIHIFFGDPKSIRKLTDLRPKPSDCSGFCSTAGWCHTHEQLTVVVRISQNAVGDLRGSTLLQDMFCLPCLNLRSSTPAVARCGSNLLRWERPGPFWS